MPTVFDILKKYQSNWEEIDSRKFTDEECAICQSCTVVSSQYGKSVCFHMGGKNTSYIPLDPTCSVNVGDTLNLKDLTLLSLKYTGTDPNQKVTKILRIKLDSSVVPVSFDNPFGL